MATVPKAIARWIILQFMNEEYARMKASYWRRRVAWLWKYLRGSKIDFIEFRCNVCGKETSYLRNELARESWSCLHCGSTVRWRSVIHALSTELFGTSLALPDFPNRPDLVGIGLSDWDGYATPLAAKIGYTNTYYHKEPFLDITSVDPSQYGRYDFIIASDVFEHICPPISKAFENARRLLKPGGVVIFTVPYVEGETTEHFPDLHSFSLQEKGGGWVLLNQTSDGRSQEFSPITFHGGPGSVLEMRLFGKDALLRDIKAAGFCEVRLYDEEYPEDGILWVPYIPEKAPYRPLIYGLDTPAWALRGCPLDTK